MPYEKLNSKYTKLYIAVTHATIDNADEKYKDQFNNTLRTFLNVNPSHTSNQSNKALIPCS